MAQDALTSVLERLAQGPVSAGQLIRELEGTVDSQDVRTAINDGFASGQIVLAPDGRLQPAQTEP
jgi:hypothetical protein